MIGSTILVCCLMLLGLAGTRIAYHEGLNGRLKRMKMSCQMLAGLMIAATFLAFSMGVRWHHVYADALHQQVERQSEKSTEMAVVYPDYHMTTPTGLEISWRHADAGLMSGRTSSGEFRDGGSGISRTGGGRSRSSFSGEYRSTGSSDTGAGNM